MRLQSGQVEHSGNAGTVHDPFGRDYRQYRLTHHQPGQHDFAQRIAGSGLIQNAEMAARLGPLRDDRVGPGRPDRPRLFEGGAVAIG